MQTHGVVDTSLRVNIAVTRSPNPAAPAIGYSRKSRLGARQGQTARRLFDSGSFFGVGVPEALVIGLLGWFLLGPEELYRLAKKVGGWLGELRGFIGQAAKQYESALDDESTRKAIDGIRQTQRTVSEITASWSSVAASLRDPLNLGATLESTYNKYSQPKDSKTEPTSAAAPTKTFPAELTAEEEDVNATDFDSPGATSSKKVQASDSDEESPEELERKRAASRQAVEGMWYKGNASSSTGPGSGAWTLPKEAEEFLERLDDRLEELDTLSRDLQDLRAGVLKDRKAIQALLESQAANQAAGTPEPPATSGQMEAIASNNKVLQDTSVPL